MTDISLAYGKESHSLPFATRHILNILHPKEVTNPLPVPELIRSRLEVGLGDGSRTSTVLQNLPTLIIIPDKTRNCAAPLVLPFLLDKLQQTGLAQSRIRFMLANGSHVQNQEYELEKILGPGLKERFQILQHDSHDETNLQFLGRTEFGTPVYLNKELLRTDQIIIVGTAVHHYFAGFGGGPKMITPGCAGYETITKNHALTISRDIDEVHDKCRPGILDGNPVQEDIKQAVALSGLKPLIIETIMNAAGQVTEIFVGELFETHRRACETVKKIYEVDISEKADLVVASCGGFPKDINLIQAHKTIYNAFQAVKPGGVLLILAECAQGVGSETFLEWFDYANTKQMVEKLRTSYKLNGTTALSLKTKAESAGIVFVSSLTTELVGKLGMHPAATVAEGWQIARKLLPENFTSFVIPNASLTFPVN